MDEGIQEQNETKKRRLQNKTILMDGGRCSRSCKNIKSGEQIQIARYQGKKFTLCMASTTESGFKS